ATSNRVTGRIATRPTRNPSAFTFQPRPRDVTRPAPVTTTRGGGSVFRFAGKSTAQPVLPDGIQICSSPYVNSVPLFGSLANNRLDKVCSGRSGKRSRRLKPA